MNRLAQTLWLVGCFVLGLGPAHAIDANTCGYTQGPGGWYKQADRSGPYALDGNCGATLIGAGAGGSATGSVTGPGTAGTQAQAVQGIPNGVPITVAPSAADSVVTAYSISATGAQPGFATAGYGTVAVQLIGTATVSVEAANDAASVPDGSATWRAVFGYTPDNAVSPASTVTAATPLRTFPAGAGLRYRINVTAVTGTVTVNVGLRTAPFTERTVFVTNPLTATLTAGTQVVGSTTLRSAGTNRSATIGTTAVTLMASNLVRQGWWVKNDNATGDLWCNFDGTATATPGGGNFRIVPGGYQANEPGFVTTNALSCISTVAGGIAITMREH